MVRHHFIFVVLLLANNYVLAQDLNFGEPIKLPATVNSGHEESMPLLSFDGKSLYFSRFASPENEGGEFAGIDIWVSERDALGGWKAATNKGIPFNNSDNNAIAGISADGNIFFLVDTSPYKKVKGIYFSKKIKGVWSKAEFVAIPGIDSQGHIGFYVSSDFSVVIISMKGSDSEGEEDLYFSLRESSGKWSQPKNMGSAVNTTGFEISPFLSQDKNRLYFSSNGHGGSGDADVFFSDRLYNSWDNWSVPKNLGEKINSKTFDAFFTIHGDSVAFFSSNRAGKSADIFMSRIILKDGNVMKDSVNRIIAETKKMLSDLQDSSKPLTVDGSGPIAFEANSITLTLKAKNQLDYLIKQRDKVQRYEIIIYPENINESTLADKIITNRGVTILNYLVTSGISPEKIDMTTTAKSENATRKSYVEVKIYMDMNKPK